MKIRDLSRHAPPRQAQTNRPEVNVRSNPLFDRATTGPPSVDQLPLKALIKVLIRFPLDGGGSSVSWPVVGQEFLLFVRAVLSSSGKKYERFYFRMV